MREIKFRAWDKRKGRMWYSVGFRDSDAGRIYLPELAMEKRGIILGSLKESWGKDLEVIGNIYE